MDTSLRRDAQPEEWAGLIPGYTLWEKLREDKLGTVYKARQHSLDRWVSVKIYDSSSMATQAYVAKTKREIDAFGRLEHPNILRALDSGRNVEYHYLITEYFDGVLLGDYIKSHGIMSEDEVLAMAEKLVSALELIWQNDMIHRDIVPENITISKTDVKLSDLGLVKYNIGGYQTPYHIPRRHYSYIPPEQIQGKLLDYRSDIYSLGAVLYFALTGRQMIDWNCSWETILDKRPEKIGGVLSAATENLLMKMVSPLPQDRCLNRQELLQNIREIQKQRKKRKIISQLISAKYFLALMVISVFVIGYKIYFQFALAAGLKPSQIFSLRAPGVVLLKVEDTLASGVIISYQDRNLVLTNAHSFSTYTFDGSQKIAVVLKDGRSYESILVKNDEEMDLALLRLPDDIGDLTTVPIAKQSEIHVGDDVFVIGHPRGYLWSLTRGTISAVRDDTIQTDADISVGNSGGPVLDTRGYMLGIATYTVGQNNRLGFAVSVKRIKHFLNNK